MINYELQIILKWEIKKINLVFRHFNEDIFNKKVKEFLNNFLRIIFFKISQ
jgi:hypothetical protein